MNESEPRAKLPPERPLSPERRQMMKEMLMEEIDRQDERDEAARRRWLPAVAAAGVLAIAVGTLAVMNLDRADDEDVVAGSPVDDESDTAEPGSDGDPNPDPRPLKPPPDARPDPDDVAQITENFAADAEVHTGEWRPFLDAERVTCLFPDAAGSTDEQEAFEFPMEDAMTEQHLAQACIRDWARSEGYTAEGAEVCVTEEDLPHPLLDWGIYIYPLPVVGIGGKSCSEEGHRPITDDDLNTLNGLRSVEASVLATPDPDSFETTVQHAETRLAEVGLELAVETKQQEPDIAYEARIDWRRGTLSVFSRVLPPGEA